VSEAVHRSRTGNPELDQLLRDILTATGAKADRDQLNEILTTAVLLAGDGADRLNLKITSAALKEMRAAFLLFAPFVGIPKVTIFGSARTRADDPLYRQTRDLAATLAGAGWMVVTGAGPGIMAAGAEGAGPEHSLGVSIRLPFEPASTVVAGDMRVTMKYFFTRKLMLLKESSAFVAVPGGFGTLDEVFELLTLVQTGKSEPAPIVLLDVPGGTYWRAWDRFLREELAGRGMVSPDDEALYRISDEVTDATAEIMGFFANYHSLRYVGDRLVIRLRSLPSPADLAGINREFGSICTTGGIEPIDALPEELAGGDHPELPRLALNFDRASHGRLRSLIDALNRLPGDSL